jgi:hypothetical protein
MPVVVPVVEGYAEVEALPVRIARPVRVKRYQVVRPGELERSCQLARRRPEGCDAILLLLDADDDCPKEIAPDLVARAQAACPDLPVAVVLAKAEFEAWFVGSLESLRGVRAIGEAAVAPETPEAIRDAKGYLSLQMPSGRHYVEVDDQPAFAQRFDLVAAREHCPSFDKFVRNVQHILATI